MPVGNQIPDGLGRQGVQVRLPYLMRGDAMPVIMSTAKYSRTKDAMIDDFLSSFSRILNHFILTDRKIGQATLSDPSGAII